MRIFRIKRRLPVGAGGWACFGLACVCAAMAVPAFGYAEESLFSDAVPALTPETECRNVSPLRPFPARLKTASPVRAVWYWGDDHEGVRSAADKQRHLVDLVRNSQERARLFVELQRFAINRLYLSVATDEAGKFLFAGHEEALADFLREARGHGVSVYGLFGDPRWSLSEAHARVVGPAGLLSEILRFNASHPLGFAGIQADVEPYFDPVTGQTTDLTRVGPQYLELVRAISRQIGAFRTAGAKAFAFEAAIPFWYSLPADDGSQPVTLFFDGEWGTIDHHVMRQVDGVAVMAYRDIADGVNGVIALARPSVDLAHSMGKSVVVALETQAPNPRYGVTPHLTLFEEGVLGLCRVSVAVADGFADDAAFAGLAFHHYASLVALPIGASWRGDLLVQGLLWEKGLRTGTRTWDVSGNYGAWGNHARSNRIESDQRGAYRVTTEAVGGWGTGISFEIAAPERKHWFDAGAFDAVDIRYRSDISAVLQIADARWSKLDDSIPLGNLPSSDGVIRNGLLPIGRVHPIFNRIEGETPEMVFSGSEEYGWIDKSKIASLFLRFPPPQEGYFEIVSLRLVRRGANVPWERL